MRNSAMLEEAEDVTSSDAGIISDLSGEPRKQKDVSILKLVLLFLKLITYWYKSFNYETE